MEDRIAVRPGDLVKHADWELSPVNSYRTGVGLVVRYDTNKQPDSTPDEVLKDWVVVQWLPFNERTCTTIYHVESLVRLEDCRD